MTSSYKPICLDAEIVDLSSFIAFGFDKFSYALPPKPRSVIHTISWLEANLRQTNNTYFFNKINAVLQDLNNEDSDWIADLPSRIETLLKFCYSKDRFNNSVSKSMLEEILEIEPTFRKYSDIKPSNLALLKTGLLYANKQGQYLTLPHAINFILIACNRLSKPYISSHPNESLTSSVIESLETAKLLTLVSGGGEEVKGEKYKELLAFALKIFKGIFCGSINGLFLEIEAKAREWAGRRGEFCLILKNLVERYESGNMVIGEWLADLIEEVEEILKPGTAAAKLSKMNAHEANENAEHLAAGG